MIPSTARKYGSHSIPSNMCTAMNALSRPAAVLMNASSGATARTRPLVRAVVRARERGARVWKDEEFEVVVGDHALLEVLEHLLERCRRVHAAERERGHALKRRLHDHAQRTEAHTSRAEDLWLALGRAFEQRAVAEHERDRAQLRGDVLKARARAVRRRRDRAPERLHVDVAEILEREPVLEQPATELVDSDARLRAHPRGGHVHLEHGAEALEREHHPVGARDIAERVPAARHA